jgi:hypothetical protein
MFLPNEPFPTHEMGHPRNSKIVNSKSRASTFATSIAALVMSASAPRFDAIAANAVYRQDDGIELCPPACSAAATFARLSQISIRSAATVICSTIFWIRLFISTGGMASQQFVFFWGTTYRDSDNNVCVRCLCWHRGGWRWHYGWLASDFLGNDPAAVRGRSPSIVADLRADQNA